MPVVLDCHRFSCESAGYKCGDIPVHDHTRAPRWREGASSAPKGPPGTASDTSVTQTRWVRGGFPPRLFARCGDRGRALISPLEEQALRACPTRWNAAGRHSAAPSTREYGTAL